MVLAFFLNSPLFLSDHDGAVTHPDKAGNRVFRTGEWAPMLEARSTALYDAPNFFKSPKFPTYVLRCRLPCHLLGIIACDRMRSLVTWAILVTFSSLRLSGSALTSPGAEEGCRWELPQSIWPILKSDSVRNAKYMAVQVACTIQNWSW